MTVRIAINGFGRMGRLALRAAWAQPGLTFVHLNEIACDAVGSAHLLNFDSVHGRWDQVAKADGPEALFIEGQRISHSSAATIEAVDWAGLGVDVVIEATGAFRQREQLQAYLDAGVKKVVVAAPVKDALNIVMGVNDTLYDPERHDIVTAASCTTNCLAPVVKVLHESVGIVHGTMTTIHNITNTQRIVDHGHRDLRRARACGESLIPTSTGSAKAITDIFPPTGRQVKRLGGACAVVECIADRFCL